MIIADQSATSAVHRAVPEDGQAVTLMSCRQPGPDFAMRVLAGPVGGLWLRSEWRESRDEDWSPAVVSRWSPADVIVAADWFRGVATGQEQPRQRFVWFGSPALALGLIERDQDRVVIDVCYTLSAAASWPELTGDEAEPREGDDSFGYLTVDVLSVHVAAAAAAWAELAERLASTLVPRPVGGR